MTRGETCLRCSAELQWRHGTWQCPRCRYKVGCCEGETGECGADAAAAYASLGAAGSVSASGSAADAASGASSRSK